VLSEFETEETAPPPPLGVVVAIIFPALSTARKEPVAVPKFGRYAVPKYPVVEEAYVNEARDVVAFEIVSSPVNDRGVEVAAEGNG
jgi:hypothetical protein